MSTQFDTGQTYQQYQDEIANGPAQLPVVDDSYVSGTAARVATSKALASALTSPTSINPATQYTITAVSGDGTDVTFTAANNLVAGAKVTLSELTGDFAVLNNTVVTVLSSGLSSSAFKIASAVGAPTTFTVTAVVGNGTDVTITAANTLEAGDQVTFAGLGGAFTGLNTGTYTVLSSGLSSAHFKIVSALGYEALTITAVSGSGTVVTFTAANSLAGGEAVTFAGLAGGYSGFNSGGPYTVASATGTNFTVTSATTGATTTGTATAVSPSTTGTGASTAPASTGLATLPHSGEALPSVAIDAADNNEGIPDYSPERYVL